MMGSVLYLLQASVSAVSKLSTGGLNKSRPTVVQHALAEQTDCSVCLGSLDEPPSAEFQWPHDQNFSVTGDQAAIFGQEPVLARVRSCGHAYHADCLAHVFRNGRQICPLCRSSMSRNVALLRRRPLLPVCDLLPSVEVPPTTEVLSLPGTVEEEASPVGAENLTCDRLLQHYRFQEPPRNVLSQRPPPQRNWAPAPRRNSPQQNNRIHYIPRSPSPSPRYWDDSSSSSDASDSDDSYSRRRRGRGY